MTLRNAFPGAELHFESEGISELEEKEVHSSNVTENQTLFWELHILPGLPARNLDMVGDP